MKRELKETLNENVWSTAGIMAGHDKGAIGARNKSIDNTIEALASRFIIVSKTNIDMLLELICEHTMARMNPELAQKMYINTKPILLEDMKEPEPKIDGPTTTTGGIKPQ